MSGNGDDSVCNVPLPIQDSGDGNTRTILIVDFALSRVSEKNFY